MIESTSEEFAITQLLNTINYWFYYTDKNVPVDAIYLDFRKAFDTVPHERLLRKLSGYGVNGNLLSWIQDFLSERTQFVKIRALILFLLLAVFPRAVSWDPLCLFIILMTCLMYAKLFLTCG